jgi:hypothetical protein
MAEVKEKRLGKKKRKKYKETLTWKIEETHRSG